MVHKPLCGFFLITLRNLHVMPFYPPISVLLERLLQVQNASFQGSWSGNGASLTGGRPAVPFLHRPNQRIWHGSQNLVRFSPLPPSLPTKRPAPASLPSMRSPHSFCSLLAQNSRHPSIYLRYSIVLDRVRVAATQIGEFVRVPKRFRQI